MKTKSPKQPKTHKPSKTAIQLKDTEPRKNPSGGDKATLSEIPVVKTWDKASP
ncbi:MAG: hypothetical protein QOE70_638 [Chthoniobacter sp.]|jgi:hypothetical protein|nr:hypothetical protein [Chthoniobacter sp.]